MKLYATIKNNRGGKKSTGDNTRILIELSYGNKMLGTIGLYSIIDDKKEGYRIVWQEDGKGFNSSQKPILELETTKAIKQKGETKWTPSDCIKYKCTENGHNCLPF